VVLVPPPLHLDQDRLFPADPPTRERARRLYEIVADHPIISPHSHVDPALLVQNDPFPDPAELFVRQDHYVTRLLHAAGISLDELGLTDASGCRTRPAREVWRTFCRNWHLFAGTASGYWLTTALSEVLGVTEEPSEDVADAMFDDLTATLASETYRPRALFHRFRIEVLATTDDPMSDLHQHELLAGDPSFTGKVIPTFRPDPYLDPRNPGFVDGVRRLAEWNGSPDHSYRGYLGALEGRRRYFIDRGAVSADHGVLEPLTLELDELDAAALFDKALTGSLDETDARAFAAHMLFQMGRMSVADGLVMTLHPGVFRNHNSDTYRRFGPDTGHDIPVSTSFVHNLRPLLERFGNDPSFHLVLFTVDETTFSREIAPLAGFYPSVYIGAPWWFLDAPDAVKRFRAAVTETAGFYRSSGFIDDTRAFLSIPARHDMSRRLDAAFLAGLVAEGRVSDAMAERIIVDLVHTQPKKVFKL
jgi:glucuronate isomerase